MRRLASIIALGLTLPALIVFGMGADGESGSGYEVRAIFDNVASAVPGEDVKVAGAKVGVIFYGDQGYLVLPSYNGGTAFDKDGQEIKKFSGGGDDSERGYRKAA